MQRLDVGPGIFCLSDLLNVSECEAMTARAEAMGFEPATIDTPTGTRRDALIRNNDRVMFDDPDQASMLWQRMGRELPAVRAGRQARGLNERFRVYRYRPGQSFDWHADAPFRRSNGEMSLFTFMIYLNEGYTGGTTVFADHEINGRCGMALIFDHGLQHSGAAVTSGIKYALRSDVMYGPIGHLSG